MAKLKYRKALEALPPYIPAKSLEEIKRQYVLEQIVRLSANENTMGCSSRVKPAIARALQNIYLYPDGSSTNLKSKLAAIHHCQPEQLIIGSGSFEILTLIAEVLIEPGAESIIPAPTFGWYQTITKAMGGKVIQVPLKNHGIDLESIQEKLNQSTKIIWLCNPNNPTGTIFTKDLIEKFLKQIPDDIMVVFDEAYFDYVEREDYPDTAQLSFPNIISLRTFSKVYGLAGLRVGYGIGAPEFINMLNRIRLPLNVNVLAQAAAIASLGDPDFKTSVLENNHRGKQFFYQSLEAMGLEYIPTETNFIMADVAQDSVQISEKLLQKGVSVRAGTEFAMPTWLRITIGRPEENELFIEKLKEVLMVKGGSGS
ncbi:MAG TPA: histidinol-phosphate transaminase [Firmicutes bacterium]|jgi:histidinol-phosphate aminotransferase|nr:histidinol-phosphate transaminase [Bacillota bacterium]